MRSLPLLLVTHPLTGVDKGAQGAQAPQWPGQKNYFVKIEVLTLCLHLKDDISVTDILKISKIT